MTKGPISQFITHHYRHFNSATLVDAAKAYDEHMRKGGKMMLAMAGANYYMGVPVGDDVMLSYQDTSFHDDATLRELSHRLPAPEFHKWMMKMELMDEHGRLTPKAGDASIFLK